MSHADWLFFTARILSCQVCQLTLILPSMLHLLTLIIFSYSTSWDSFWLMQVDVWFVCLQFLVFRYSPSFPPSSSPSSSFFFVLFPPSLSSSSYPPGSPLNNLCSSQTFYFLRFSHVLLLLFVFSLLETIESDSSRVDILHVYSFNFPPKCIRMQVLLAAKKLIALLVIGLRFPVNVRPSLMISLETEFSKKISKSRRFDWRLQLSTYLPLLQL